MAGSAVLPIREAIGTILGADATLTSTLGAGVCQTPGDGTALPYVIMDEDTEVLDDAFAQSGRDVTVGIHTWSENREGTEAHDIANRVLELLDWATLTVTGWQFVSCQLDNTAENTDADYRHIIQRFRVRVHE